MSGTALDTRMADAIDRVGSVDVLVGIPSYKNARTIGHVARTVSDGLRLAFPEARAVVVNADGGSDDGTTDRVREALDGTPSVVGAYVGPPGKGSAFKAIFETAVACGARACAVVDSDLRSITPEWIERLLGPVLDGKADYVAPLYARHKHDGTITNTVAYPLTRALYGKRVRQPIGGEFAFTGDLARAFLSGGGLVPQERRPRGQGAHEVEHLGVSKGSPRANVGGLVPQERRPRGQGAHEVEHLGVSEGSPRANVGMKVWSSDIARFGIDIFMTTTALVRGATVAQAFLGAKVHDPKDPGADLGPMFRQVVGTCFRLATANVRSWKEIDGSVDVPVIGEVRPVEPEEVRADADLLVRKLRSGAAEHAATWKEALSEGSAAAVRRALDERVPRSLSGAVWADVVYDLLAASAGDVERTDAYVQSMLPLYFGRVAAFIAEVDGMTTADAEEVVETQARAFESRKPHVREIWPAA